MRIYLEVTIALPQIFPAIPLALPQIFPVGLRDPGDAVGQFLIFLHPAFEFLFNDHRLASFFHWHTLHVVWSWSLCTDSPYLASPGCVSSLTIRFLNSSLRGLHALFD